MAVTGLLILLLTYVALTFLIVRPLQAVTSASGRVADGRTEIEVPARGAGEVRALARSFNAMAGQVRADREQLEARLAELEATTAELAQAEDQVLRSARLASVGRLAAGIAHEIGNPLTAVVGLVELARDDDMDPAERDELLENGIRLRAVGRVEKLPPRVREILDPLVAETAHLDGMTLTLALSYGGREEILDAPRALARRACAGELDVDAIDEAQLEGALPSLAVGRVDLLVRTGGEQRISNFLLWGAAYAELHFTNALWPDFDEAELYAAIAAYQGRERRFGRVQGATTETTAPVLPSLAHEAAGE